MCIAQNSMRLAHLNPCEESLYVRPISFPLRSLCRHGALRELSLCASCFLSVETHNPLPESALVSLTGGYMRVTAWRLQTLESLLSFLGAAVALAND